MPTKSRYYGRFSALSIAGLVLFGLQFAVAANDVSGSDDSLSNDTALAEIPNDYCQSQAKPTSAMEFLMKSEISSINGELENVKNGNAEGMKELKKYLGCLVAWSFSPESKYEIDRAAWFLVYFLRGSAFDLDNRKENSFTGARKRLENFYKYLGIHKYLSNHIDAFRKYMSHLQKDQHDAEGYKNYHKRYFEETGHLIYKDSQNKDEKSGSTTSIIGTDASNGHNEVKLLSAKNLFTKNWWMELAHRFGKPFLKMLEGIFEKKGKHHHEPSRKFARPADVDALTFLIDIGVVLPLILTQTKENGIVILVRPGLFELDNNISLYHLASTGLLVLTSAIQLIKDTIITRASEVVKRGRESEADHHNKEYEESTTAFSKDHNERYNTMIEKQLFYDPTHDQTLPTEKEYCDPTDTKSEPDCVKDDKLWANVQALDKVKHWVDPVDVSEKARQILPNKLASGLVLVIDAAGANMRDHLLKGLFSLDFAGHLVEVLDALPLTVQTIIVINDRYNLFGLVKLVARAWMMMPRNKNKKGFQQKLKVYNFDNIEALEANADKVGIRMNSLPKEYSSTGEGSVLGWTEFWRNVIYSNVEETSKHLNFSAKKGNSEQKSDKKAQNQAN